MTVSKLRCLSVSIVVLFLTCIASLAQAPADQFTIIALPDTQFYSESYPQVFSANMQWVVNNASALKIKYVVGLGDIVNVGTSTTQWQNADNAVRLLDNAGIPYGMAIGNHDYDSTNAMDVSARKTVNFNKWFGPGRYALYPWYGASNYPAGSNENFYTVLHINDVDYMFLYLEFYPRNGALQWAANVLQANQDKKIIVVTHGYENSDNFRMGTCDVSGPVTYNIAKDNDGDMMWSKLVSQYSNVIMVLSGHMTNAGRETDFGIAGNLVNQMMSAHYPNDPNGGNGYLRILTITPSLNKIDVKTYSPYANLYKTDSANQFSLTYQGAPSGTVAGQAKIRGRIRATDCTAITTATANYESDGSSGSVAVDSKGNYTVTVQSPETYTVTAAASGYTTQSVTVPVQDGYAVPARFVLATAPPDFSLASTPASQTLTQGDSTSYSVSATGSDGFSGTVDLSASGVPSGATATFTPTSITGSGTANLSVATTSTTPAGTYPLTITGTSGTLQHTAPATLVVNALAQDFSLAVSPSSQSVVQAASTSYSVSSNALNGFSDVVALSATGMPTGATATFSPTSITASGTSTLSVSTLASTPAGSYPITITGKSGSAQHTVQATLVVTVAPDFTFAAAPASQAVTQGVSAGVTGTVTAVGGFTGPVTFAASGLPSGATAAFSPATVNGAGTTAITISTNTTTPTGTYTATITATSGSITHSASVTIVVNEKLPPDFALSVTPASQAVQQSSSAAFNLTVAAQNGFSSPVSFAVSGLPAGTTASFSPTSVSGSGSATLNVNSVSATPGNYTLTITATSDTVQHQAVVSLAVTDFTMTVSPTSLSYSRGKAVATTVTITALNGYSGTETLSVSGVPAGVTATFSSPTITGSGSSTLTLKPSSVKTGTYVLTIKALNSTTGLYRTGTATLTVQ